MPGKKNHKRVVAKCFIAGAMANILFTTVLVAGSVAQDKKFPFPADLAPNGDHAWPVSKGLKTYAKADTKIAAKTDTKASAKTETKSTGKSDGKSGAKSDTKSDAKTTGKPDEPPSRPSVGKVAVWELQQQCKGIKEVNCLISQEAVRIRADKMNITFLFKAPKWDAYMYNTDTKNFCFFPYEEWKSKGFFSQVMKSKRHEKDRNKNLKVKKTGKSQQIAGKKAVEIAIETLEGERYATIWATPSPMVPKQFSEVIGSLIMVPIKESGAPLRVEVRMRANPQRPGYDAQRPGSYPSKAPGYYSSKGPAGLSSKGLKNSKTSQSPDDAPLTKIEPVLDTTKAIDKQVEASIFDQPTGYKKVRDEMALLFAEKDGGDDDGSMFNFDSEPRLKKKPLSR